MGHTAIVLNKHNRPALLHMSNIIQLTATSTAHIIAIYVQKQICPSNDTYMEHMQVPSCADKTNISVKVTH